MPGRGKIRCEPPAVGLQSPSDAQQIGLDDASGVRGVVYFFGFALTGSSHEGEHDLLPVFWSGLTENLLTSLEMGNFQ